MIRSNDVSETFEFLVIPAPGGVHISLHPMRFRRCGEPESQVRQRGVIVACDNLSVTVRSEKMQRLAPVVEVPIDNNHPFVQPALRTLQASVHEEVMGAGIVVSDGTYPNSAMTFRTARAVSCATRGWSFMTRETVDGETPAFWATSIIDIKNHPFRQYYDCKIRPNMHSCAVILQRCSSAAT